ncbi:MAG: SRPBCC family protein [Solirubrobacterales bacterium]|nr:SRPBCC family protein [Solirubrobacterales bacterium]
MKFVNEIAIDAPADELFEFLSDVERVAPCLPGARIEGRDGDAYQGSMRVKVGPISGTYTGTMRFAELDREQRRAVMSARADEAAGQGNAEAWIESEVTESEGRSQLRMATDLQLRGRVAQFGRGTIERIAQRMFAEFASNIEERIANGGQPQRSTDAETSPAPPRSDEEKAEPPALDAFELIAGPIVQKALPVVIPALIGFGYGYLLGRLRELKR